MKTKWERFIWVLFCSGLIGVSAAACYCEGDKETPAVLRAMGGAMLASLVCFVYTVLWEIAWRWVEEGEKHEIRNQDEIE